MLIKVDFSTLAGRLKQNEIIGTALCVFEKSENVKFRRPVIFCTVRDGPLENLYGGAGEVQKKYSRKGKLNGKKFMHAN